MSWGRKRASRLPGLLINCGDSHTSTHGAFGALAFGIGATEVAHVLATQTIWQRKPRSMRITVDGTLGAGVTAKDIALGWIAELGTDGAQGHAVEYAGSAISGLSMEGRMTLCNLSIEGGARFGMVAPDGTTFAYLEGRRFAPKGADLGCGLHRLAPARQRRGRSLRPRGDARRRPDFPDRDMGHQPRTGVANRRGDPRPCGAAPRKGAGRAGGAGLHGAETGSEAGRHAGRSGVHRFLHERADRGSACGGSGPARVARPGCRA